MTGSVSPSTRVLLVDDAAEVRQDLRTVLTLAGDLVIVGEAGNGLEAVAQAQALRPQVVVMDLEMPVMDGYEATRCIRALCPTCRVIALTIHAGAAERRRALEAGMADVVVKGAPLEVLLRAISPAAAQP
jgi:DNA-binding NarL/FixJ family response regulator